MHVEEQRPPLRVLRAFTNPEGGALVHLHNVSGGVLGGDDLGLRVEVGEGCRVQLTTTSATRLYRCKAGAADSAQQMSVTVGTGALLEILPDPLIPFAGARYRQETRFALQPGARLFCWEVLSPGREARGELFAYDRLDLRTAIVADGMPIAYERMMLAPAAQSLHSGAVLGPYRYLSTGYLCVAGVPRADLSRWEADLTDLAQQVSQPGEALWGVSQLVGHGLIIRGLSRSGIDHAAYLFRFWTAARRLLGEPMPTLPRKLY